MSYQVQYCKYYDLCLSDWISDFSNALSSRVYCSKLIVFFAWLYSLIVLNSFDCCLFNSYVKSELRLILKGFKRIQDEVPIDYSSCCCPTVVVSENQLWYNSITHYSPLYLKCLRWVRDRKQLAVYYCVCWACRMCFSIKDRKVCTFAHKFHYLLNWKILKHTILVHC